MKRLLLSLSVLLCIGSLSAQTIAFHENFEVADSVLSSGNPLWQPESSLQTSGIFSTRNAPATTSSAYLTTNAFSTVGNTFVILNFNHICKLELFDLAEVEVSNDNGNTWTALSSSQYLGSGFLNGNSFTSASYGGTWQPSNVGAVPTNSWWKTEGFDISLLIGNVPQAKIRFKLTDGNGNGALGAYGWVIDDLTVTISPSELYPPVITMLPPNYSGVVYNLGPFNITASITDQTGVDTAWVTYTVNNGSPLTVGMTNTTGSTYVGVIPGVNNNDTVCYTVSAIDASLAANSAVEPTSGCTQFVATTGISLPYFDNFDVTTNLWSASSASFGTDWQLGTPAFGSTTGAHSAPNAWDINLTTGYSSGADATLLSPIFDFSQAVNAKLSFWHNWNAETFWDGTRLEYTTDGTTWQLLGNVNDPNAVNWYTNASINSSQMPAWDGSSSGWIQSEYDLGLLNNVVGPVQFRFIFTSDGSVEMDGHSIDDFAIILPSPQDAGVKNIIDPNVSGCVGAGSAVVGVTIKNFGTQNLNLPMDIAYVFDNNPPVIEQYNSTLAPGLIDTFYFAAPINNTVGTHTLQVYTMLTGDGFNPNDSSAVASYLVVGGVNVPYTNGFENGPASLNDFCITTGTVGNVAVVPAAANTGSQGMVMDAIGWAWNNWMVDTIPSSPNYIWNNTINPQHYAGARLVVNTASYNDLILEFDLEQLMNWSADQVNFRVRVNGTMVTPHFMPPWTGSLPYTTYRYSLQQFLPANSIVIDFESKVGDSYLNNMANFIDNVKIYEPQQYDAGVTQILSPMGMSPGGTSQTVSVKLFNFGWDTLTSMNVAYTVNAGPPTIQPWTGVLLPNSATTFNFTTPFTAPVGQYQLCSYTMLTNDGNATNDMTCATVMGIATFNAPWSDNFDGASNYFVGADGFNQWQLGTPAAPGITNAYTPTKAWEVNLTGFYQNSSNDNLYTPFFDFSGVTGAELRFYHWYETESSWDGGRVDYSTDGGQTWQVLGTMGDPNGTNWYNSSSLIGSGLPGWQGTNSGYQLSKYKLNFLNNYPNPVQFRFNFSSDGSVNSFDGWGVDNFQIYLPINAATNTLSTATSPLMLPGTNNVTTTVKNAGGLPLDSVKVTLRIDGNLIVTDTKILNPPLGIGQSTTHTFSMPWTNATAGSHTIKVWTSQPNGLPDSNLPDDTTTRVIVVLDTIPNTPYCNDFEGSLNPWGSLNALTFSDTHNSWQFGTPSQASISGAHSGTKAWTTGLSSNYLANDTSGLFTAVFDVNGTDCYQVKFWNYYKTEMGMDGGAVEYSMDLGNTWTGIGNPFEPFWYNYPTVAGLGSTPGFSGNSNGWVEAKHLLKFANAGQVVFRFRFGANGTNHNEGWAIDDFCFDNVGACVLDVNDVAQENGIILAQNVPNPANGNTSISYYIPEGGKVTFTITNLLGQVMAVSAGDKPAGSHTFEIDASAWAPGVYYYTMETGQSKLVKKMIISK